MHNQKLSAQYVLAAQAALQGWLQGRLQGDFPDLASQNNKAAGK
jgi:hypothetical protein